MAASKRPPDNPKDKKTTGVVTPPLHMPPLTLFSPPSPPPMVPVFVKDKNTICKDFSTPVLYYFEGKGFGHYFGHVAIGVTFNEIENGKEAARRCAYMSFEGAGEPLRIANSAFYYEIYLDLDVREYGAVTQTVLATTNDVDASQAVEKFGKRNPSQYSTFANNCVHAVRVFLQDMGHKIGDADIKPESLAKSAKVFTSAQYDDPDLRKLNVEIEKHLEKKQVENTEKSGVENIRTLIDMERKKLTHEIAFNIVMDKKNREVKNAQSETLRKLSLHALSAEGNLSNDLYYLLNAVNSLEGSSISQHLRAAINKFLPLDKLPDYEIVVGFLVNIKSDSAKQMEVADDGFKKVLQCITANKEDYNQEDPLQKQELYRQFFKLKQWLINSMPKNTESIERKWLSGSKSDQAIKVYAALLAEIKQIETAKPASVPATKKL